MVLKTFNLDEDAYGAYSAHCKKHGISMSKQVDRFIAEEVAKIQKSAHLAVSPSPVASAPTPASAHPMHKFC